MKTTYRWAIVGTALLLAGCGTGPKKMSLFPPDGLEQISVAREPEYGAYLLARERLNRVRPGMSRGEFIRTLRLRRPPSEGWFASFSGGDGWLVDLSRRNLNGDQTIEEYSFGYQDGRKVIERALVILKDGKVASVLEMAQTRAPSLLEEFYVNSKGLTGPATVPEMMEVPGVPSALLTGQISRDEENRLVRRHFESHHLTKEAFARAERRLARARVGMTVGELRHLLAGYFLRLRHGYIYFADGFLWGPRFQSTQTPTGSLTLIPFGYLSGTQEIQKVLIKSVDGVITDILKVNRTTPRFKDISAEAPAPPRPPAVERVRYAPAPSTGRADEGVPPVEVPTTGAAVHPEMRTPFHPLPPEIRDRGAAREPEGRNDRGVAPVEMKFSGGAVPQEMLNRGDALPPGIR